MTDLDLGNPMMAVIGKLAEKAQQPPPGTPTVQLAWRTGYQNALSDLTAELFPDWRSIAQVGQRTYHERNQSRR